MKLERLEFLDTDEGKVLNIRSYYDKSKQKLLLVWLLAFSICGIAIISQLFASIGSDMKIMVLIFAFFWLYFEFKIISAYRWRKNGEERFLFNKDTLYYGRLINNRGFLKPYSKDLLGGIRKIEIPPNNFFASMNNSYWVVAGESLAFSYAGKLVPFGLRLSEAEQKLIIQRTKTYFEEEV